MPEPTPAPQANPSRNLIVLSDGTGNSSAKLFKTNVWRLYEALDLNCPDQIALYDDGVGTAAFAPLAMLGGAFGWGLKRNVLDLYTFLCRNYREGDRIFAFGFSRGAFTARVVASLVAHEGLVGAGATDAEIERLAKWAYRSYRARRYRNSPGVRALRGLRDVTFRLWDRMLGRALYEQADKRRPDIAFVGVWDTVAAYGLPIEELTRGWDNWIWPMTPRDQRLSPKVKRACHALSLNDERQTFFPVLWDESEETINASSTRLDEERLSQVWFAGVHADVGGGYPDDSLALAPLTWMATEAGKCGLRFMPHLRRKGGAIPDLWQERSTPCAPQHDSRKGVAAYYRYHPRPVARLCESPDNRVSVRRPKVHESVFERIRDGLASYAPFVLPADYAVVTRDRWILYSPPPTTGASAAPPAPATTTGASAARAAGPNPFEHATQAISRSHAQERAWNLVWGRRLLYFATLAVTLTVLVLPFLATWERIDTPSWQKPLAGAVDLASQFAPGFAARWLEPYKAKPFPLVAGVIAVLLLMRWSTRVEQALEGHMTRVWRRHRVRAVPVTPEPEPADWIYRLRTSAAYRGTLRFFSHVFWPHVFGLAMLLLLVVVIPLRLGFAIAVGGGLVCGGAASPSSDGTLAFTPNELCHVTHVQLTEGVIYRAEIALPRPCSAHATCVSTDAPPCADRAPWIDGSYPVDSPAGLPASRALAFRLGVPLRRVHSASWFVPIASIGDHLPEQHPLDRPVTDFRAERSGRLSLFVNDGVLKWPFYANNQGGAARVRITPWDGNQPPVLEPFDPFACRPVTP